MESTIAVQFGKYCGSSHAVQYWINGRHGVLFTQYCMVELSQVDTKTDALLFRYYNDWCYPKLVYMLDDAQLQKCGELFFERSEQINC